MNYFTCPLCQLNKAEFLLKDKKRKYNICKNCNTIYVPKEYHLTDNEEKKRYDQHTNSSSDPYYKNFLNRIVSPITVHIKPGSTGLDFGCGPGPILKDLFRPKNISIKEYDLYYNNNKSLLKRKWDFIVSTEVIEHTSQPFNIISMLWELINPHGVLAIMTNRHTKETNFASWYYKGDPTHICFLSKESFYWIAKQLNAELEFFDKDITILKKK